MINKNKLLKSIHLILALIVLLWIDAGIFSYITSEISIIIRLSIYLVWLLIAVVSDKKYTTTLLRITLPLLSFIAIMKLSLLFTNNSNINGYINNCFYIFMVTSIFIYYMNKDKGSKKIILFTLLIDIIYVGINTLIKLNENDMLARILTTSAENQEKILEGIKYKAIGSFSYCYGLVMILLVMIDYLFAKKDKAIIVNIIDIIIIALFIELLFKAQFMIAIILFVMFFIKILLDKLLKGKKVMYICSICVLILTIIFLPMILGKLAEIDGISVGIKEKIIEIKDAMEGNNRESTDLNGRMDLYTKSINSFFNNIFVGSFGEDTVRTSFYIFRFLRTLWIVVEFIVNILY